MATSLANSPSLHQAGARQTLKWQTHTHISAGPFNHCTHFPIRSFCTHQQVKAAFRAVAPRLGNNLEILITVVTQIRPLKGRTHNRSSLWENTTTSNKTSPTHVSIHVSRFKKRGTQHITMPASVKLLPSATNTHFRRGPQKTKVDQHSYNQKAVPRSDEQHKFNPIANRNWVLLAANANMKRRLSALSLYPSKSSPCCVIKQISKKTMALYSGRK